MKNMIELLLESIAALGSTEAQNILTSAGESTIKKCKESQSWENLLAGTGEFFFKNEKKENSFFEDLSLVLSKENMSSVAKDLKSEDGYNLKYRLYQSFMQLMNKYEIPYEIAESYTFKIIYTVLEQLRTINPDKYEHYFLQEWRDEQDRSFLELQNRIDKMSHEITIYNHEQLSIASSGQMDIELRRSTQFPSIGIEFFIIDDENFQNEFEDQRYEELVYIRGRSREETIYCILNELWRLNDKRPIYIVKNLESWNKLQSLGNEDNVYIPWFYADEIVAIENNTNIFVLDENTPAFKKSVLILRPRTRNTLLKCLQAAGMEYEKACALLTDTHGLYSQMKKQLFRGEYLKKPLWLEGISEKAQKTCLLIGSWEEIEGDKLIIESLYGNSYDKFLDEILPYSKGEDPFLYLTKYNGSLSYYLASTDNIWSYLNVFTNEDIWKSFIIAVLEVINESENLFTYDNHERLLAQINGERLFWSSTIRKGMLKTLLIKGAYQKDEETQLALNDLVEKILGCVTTSKQWIYISRFWRDLCEISPLATLQRLERELYEDSGLLSLFENQTSDFIFERNSYIDILWGNEQLLCQKDYFWPAFRWLLKLDSYNFEYKSNSPKNIFEKIFCTWMNFSPLVTADEKITAAEIALDISPLNTWNYLFASIHKNSRSIWGELSSPKYRDYSKKHPTSIYEMQKTHMGYLTLLIECMDFSVDRWEKMIDLSDHLPDDLRKNIFEELLYEIDQMSDEEVMIIKNRLRHFIYRHRYFASSDWAIAEEKIVEYEKLLDDICINVPEYEYSYLFLNKQNYPLLHPFPYDKEDSSDHNEKATQELIQKKLVEFQERGYDLTVLAAICSQKPYSPLGKYLSKYWNNGKWDYITFKNLLNVNDSGAIAISYMESFSIEEHMPYNEIIADLENNGYSTDVLANAYRIEAGRTKEIPLVTYTSEQIKKEFWNNAISCDETNSLWALIECKKYALLNVYLDQVHQIHYRYHLSANQIFECFADLEDLPHEECSPMTSFHLEQLLSVIQDAYIDDIEKCIRIAHLEILFINLLDWKKMKCFHHMINHSPELFAQLVEVVFKKDHEENQEPINDQSYLDNMYKIYEKTQFCPTENNGVVLEEQLEQWIEKYRLLLIDNDQESLFTFTLGRLFSFSPIGSDNHKPCEAVRKMIEKYGDEKMISNYKTTIYNSRGVFSPSAGKEELKIAEKFKENAQYLEPHYPKTAKIFFSLYEKYKKEADRERMDDESV